MKRLVLRQQECICKGNACRLLTVVLFTFIVLGKYMFFCSKTQNTRHFSNICLSFLTNYLLILGDKRKKMKKFLSEEIDCNNDNINAYTKEGDKIQVD